MYNSALSSPNHPSQQTQPAEQKTNRFDPVAIGLFLATLIVLAIGLLMESTPPQAAGAMNSAQTVFQSEATLRPTLADDLIASATGLTEQLGFQGISLRTMLIIGHIVGLVIGFGSVVFLDLYLLRHLIAVKIEAHTYSMVHFGTRLVTLGLIIMWVTGLGFLALYWFESPEKLANQKIWAKLTIVAILTLNGMVIHGSALEKLKTKVGKLILEGETAATRNFMLLTGAVSFASWSLAMVFGVIKEFNNVVPINLLFGGYLVLIGLAFTAFLGLHKASQSGLFQKQVA